MQKPITHFVESPSIHEFCAVFGDYGENLDPTQKICLMTTIASYANVLGDGLDSEDIPSEVYKACEIGFGTDTAEDWFECIGDFVGSLSCEESIKLIQALTSNI